VREALERVYGRGNPETKLRTLRGIEGLWRDHDEVGDTDAYVRRLRSGKLRKKRMGRT